MKIYRQGDVLLIRRRSKPVGAARVKAKGGRYVLAEGEATGHAHAILADESTEVEVYETQDGILFVSVNGIAILRHEEHDPVELRKGTYEVRRQREYSPRKIHNVRD